MSGVRYSGRSVVSGMLLGALAACCIAAAQATAQEVVPTGGPAFKQADGPVDIRANRLVYDRNTGDLEAWGNAVVVVGQDELRADHMRGSTKTGMLYAEGNVVLKQAGRELRGKAMRYNMADKTGVWEGLAGEMDPFHVIRTAQTERKDVGGQILYVIHDGEVTTCNREHGPHYRVGVHRAELVPGHHLKVRGAVWYLGRVPVFYVPFWYRVLKQDFGFRFYPGHSSRMGTFLLSSVRYRVNPLVTGESHFDVRSERGLGLGQDLDWRVNGTDCLGDLETYYLDDRKPEADGEDADAAGIDSQRYRLKLKHRQSFGDRAYFLTELQYLSDGGLLEEFFEDEYRDRRQPDNYASYMYRGDRFTAGLLARARLNDFYTTVTRLPELSLDVLQQQVGDSTLYYESETGASGLEKQWESGAQEDDYSAFRVDSRHTLSRPSREFGFLNLTPRVGWRGTYYSDTRRTVTHTNILVTTTTNAAGVVAYDVAGTTYTEELPMGSDFRSSPELGCEVSFKAFRTWGGVDRPRRHVVEPYADYTIRPEPSLLPENIYQFDEVDRIGKDHSVRFGVRNKLQTKREGNPWDLVDLDVNTRLNMEPESGAQALGEINFDAEIMPSKWFKVDLDGRYDLDGALLDRFNVQVNVSRPDSWTAVTEYRIREGESDIVFGDFTVPAGSNWAYNIYGRYRVDDARWEEQGGYIQRNLDCMKIRTGAGVMPGYTRDDGTKQESNWRVTLEMWLTAFPNFGFSGKHRH